MSNLMKKSPHVGHRRNTGTRIASDSLVYRVHGKDCLVLCEPKRKVQPRPYYDKDEVERQLTTWKARYNEQRRTIAKLDQEVEELKAKLSVYERKSTSINHVNEIKEQYLREMVQSSEFGKLLNCTRQNINRLRREHKLLAVSGKNGNYYPKWQLDIENSLYPCIPHVINALGFDNQWTTIQFFHTVFERLGNLTPIKYLHSHPNDEVEIPRLARQYFEQICS